MLMLLHTPSSFPTAHSHSTGVLTPCQQPQLSLLHPEMGVLACGGWHGPAGDNNPSSKVEVKRNKQLSLLSLPRARSLSSGERECV